MTRASAVIRSVALAAVSAGPLHAEGPALIAESVAVALARETSGESALRDLQEITRHHRTRGSRGYRAAAEHVVARLREHGLADVHIEALPADGRVFYGTQRSRPAWDAEFAELWELRRDGSGPWAPALRLASWEAMPITLAQDSASADVTADLVDVGAGTREADYAGREVRGKLVLASAQPGEVARLAVEGRGAAGIVSYAQNQRTAWHGEDENLVRWGHLDTFAATPTFAFMVSLKQARALRERLGGGETIRLHAVVRAGQRPGAYDVVTATIPGADPVRAREEIVFSCHLDHPRPGANDNASGCAAILEVARTLSRLVRDNVIPPPARTIRFVWPPEIEGTLALLVARPEIALRAKAAIHLDMVGGGPVTKAVFHVTRGPASLPSFVYDVAEALAAFVNRETDAFASGRASGWPLHAPEGGKEPLRAELVDFTLGSDHQIYSEGSFRVPAVYFNDWPDRYIHTNFDQPGNIDPTKLKRAAFLAAATGYVLATLGAEQAPEVSSVVRAGAVSRAARILQAETGMVPSEDGPNRRRFFLAYERAAMDSVGSFLGAAPPAAASVEPLDLLARLLGRGPARGEPLAVPDPPSATTVYERNRNVKGPVTVFGYDYLEDRLGRERAAALALLRFEGARGGGDEYAYEALNFVDGRRSVRQIRDDLAAVYGTVPLAAVAEYLQALETAGLVSSGATSARQTSIPSPNSWPR